MNGLLLDVHTLLWFDTNPQRLPPAVLSRFRQRDQRVYVSSISTWELTIKYRIGKLPEAEPLLSISIVGLRNESKAGQAE